MVNFRVFYGVIRRVWDRIGDRVRVREGVWFRIRDMGMFSVGVRVRGFSDGFEVIFRRIIKGCFDAS